MTCKPGRTSRLEHVQQPARVLAVLAAVGVFAASFFVPKSAGGLFVAAAGGLLLVSVLLWPAVTEYEFGLPPLFKAKVNPLTREQRLEAVCKRECPQITSFVQLVGIDAEQVPLLVEQAIQDTCRLWRGPVEEELVGRLLVCRAAHLIRVSLRLGGPYHVVAPDGADRYGPEWAAFAALDAHDRLVVALAEWIELDRQSVAAMLNLEPEMVQQTLKAAIGTRNGSVRA